MALLAVFALGPFVLPLVWRSPRLGPRGRWAASALVAAFTLFVVYRFISLVRTLEQALATIST